MAHVKKDIWTCDRCGFVVTIVDEEHPHNKPEGWGELLVRTPLEVGLLDAASAGVACKKCVHEVITFANTRPNRSGGAGAGNQG